MKRYNQLEIDNDIGVVNFDHLVSCATVSVSEESAVVMVTVAGLLIGRRMI